ncbi:MAG: VWA domain-containing protein [Anaerolineae bacterium]
MPLNGEQAAGWARQLDLLDGAQATGRQGEGVLQHIMLFGRLLRRLGVKVNTSQMLDLLAALEEVPITDRDDFYWTARAILVSRKDDLPRFDQAFELFWRRALAEQVPNFAPLLPQTNTPRRQPPTEKPGQEKPTQQRERTIAIADADDENEGEGQAAEGEAPDLIITASREEIIRHKDFTDFTPDELTIARRIIQDMRFQVGQRRTRRWRSGKGRRLDLRRSLRKNTRFGGEIVELAWRAPKFKPRPLVVIADISGSMEQYSRLLLHFIHTLYQGMDNVEAFVFSTRLTRITHELRNRNVDMALNEVGQRVHDWSGGTRIGESLHVFNYKWARRVLGRGAVVLIISDGWDRGDVTQLRREMDRLQRSCYRLIWLNPLLGMAGYQPLTRGIVAAMPYIDDFLPVHSLQSLADLGVLLSELGVTPRPARRQNVANKEAVHA